MKAAKHCIWNRDGGASHMKVTKTENDVKALVKVWFERMRGWSYSPVQNGLGVSGIPDRIGCVPITVTQDMVGKQIGLFVGIECKRPGRLNEKDRGMSQHQKTNLMGIIEAGGMAICCDGLGDLNYLNLRIGDLVGMWGK